MKDQPALAMQAIKFPYSSLFRKAKAVWCPRFAGMHPRPLRPKRLSPRNSRFEVWGKKGGGANF